MTMDDKSDIVSGRTKSGPLRLFLVEDSAAVRDLMVENIASMNGVSFGGCADTEDEALEKLRRQTCDVLIVDIELRQGNGMSLLRTLARNRLQPDMLKIIFSNHVNGDYRRIGEQYGVRFFFDKAAGFLPLRTLLEQLGAAARVA